SFGPADRLPHFRGAEARHHLVYLGDERSQRFLRQEIATLGAREGLKRRLIDRVVGGVCELDRTVGDGATKATQAIAVPAVARAVFHSEPRRWSAGTQGDDQRAFHEWRNVGQGEGGLRHLDGG